MLYKATVKNSAENVKKVYKEILDKHAKGTLTKEELHKSTTRFMGRTDEEA